MGIKETFEEGLKNRDWGMIAKVYYFFYDAEPPGGTPKETAKVNKEELSIIHEHLQLISDDLLIWIDELQTTLQLTPKPTQKKKKTSKQTVKKKRAPTRKKKKVSPNTTDSNTTFFTDHVPGLDDNENYIEGIREHAKVSTSRRAVNQRSEYQPDIRTCSSCKQEFDFKKEYPVGKLTTRKEELCNKCLSRQHARGK